MRRRPLYLIPLLALAMLGGARPADATITLRQRFFGPENVDPGTGAVRPDRVILSWFGVTNFAAAIGGNVVLLDAWVPRGEYSGYVPTDPAQLALLSPSHILLGHGHFDHAADAAAIAKASGATVVGTAEHCVQIHRQDASVACAEAFAPGAALGSTTELDDLLPGVEITVVKHLHSAAEPHDPSDLHAPAAPPPDANAVVFHLPAPADTQHLLTHLGDAEGGTVLWQFRVGDFSLTWHDSSGPLKEVAPSVFDAFRALPPTDVELGAIMGFNQITNGLRDPRMYTEAIAPRIFVPEHHDNWAPGLSTRGENYQPLVQAELAKIPEASRPILRFISDPQDYVRPEALTFDVASPFWD
jgi:L-ascorbate metabolism protein UlaG (beta-lactamase superfamily)